MIGKMNISIVILSCNRLKELKQNLEALIAMPETWSNIYVVDNASTDGTQKYLESLGFDRVHILLQEKNLGVAAGRNVGLRMAEDEIVVCLDDDALMSPTQFGLIKDIFSKESNLGVLCPLVFHGETGIPQNPHGNYRVEVANYHGAAHIFRKQGLEKIGFLDERCFFGGEELDSCIHLYEVGYRCVYVPEVTAKHYSFMRSGSQGVDRFLHWTFNYARVLYKNFPSEMARCYANRLLVARIFHGWRQFGGTTVLRIWRADQKGRAAGKLQHCPVSDSTIAFYMNEDLRPEFGNVPLWRKGLARMKSWFIS